MSVQQFNEVFLQNAKVPGTGTMSGVGPPAVTASANGIPGRVDQADGTENLKSDGVQKHAAPLSPNPGGKDHRPTTVVSFQDAVV